MAEWNLGKGSSRLSSSQKVRIKKGSFSLQLPKDTKTAFILKIPKFGKPFPAVIVRNLGLAVDKIRVRRSHPCRNRPDLMYQVFVLS